MRHPSFVCVLAAVLAAVLGDASASDRAESLLEQVTHLEPAEQQRFIGWVETRMNRANQIVLPQAEAATARASLQTRLRKGAMTWAALQRLLDELDERELEAVETLTRQYRLQTHRTFRRARDEYRRRQQAWFDTYTAWQKAGRPLAEQEALLDWLTEAIRVSTPGSTASLPEPLRFGTRSLASLLPAKPPPPVATKQPPAEPLPANETVEPAVSIASLPTTPEPALPVDAPQETGLDPSLPSLLKQTVELVATDRAAIPLEQDATVAVATATYPTTSPAQASLNPAEPQFPALGEQSRRETKTVCVSAPLVDPHEPVAHEAPLPDQLALHQTPEYPVRVANDGDLPQGQVLFPDLPIMLDQEGAEAPILNRLPSEPDLTTFPISICESVPRTVRDPVVAESPPEVPLPSEVATEPPQEPPGQVNLTELRSRIAGTNMALKAMEDELYESRQWTPAQLSLLVTRLHVLALRVEDSRLFRQSVPEDVRELIDTADSPKPTITLLASRIAETRQRIASDSYSGTETERQAALAQLDELSHRLVEIAALPQR